jgi:hypothetical protein
MSPKIIISLSVLIFSTIGGYLPVLFGADMLSMSALIGNGIGGVIGLYVGYKLSFGNRRSSF